MVELKSTQFALGEKLRRLALRAQFNNPVDVPPLTLPPAYANSLAVRQGEVYSRNNNAYVVAVAGTTAATGGPSTTTSGDVIADGSANLSFFGSLPRSANDPDAPVLTSGANPNLGMNWQPVANPDVYRVLGATPTVYRTNFWDLRTFVPAAAAASASRGASVVFMTDAPKFSILILSNSNAQRVVIDGRSYSLQGMNPGGSDVWYTFDYSTVGGRKFRTVEILTNKSVSYFGQVQTSAADQVIAPPAIDSVRRVVLGDSLEAGAGPGPWLAGGTPCQLVGKMLGIDDTWNFSTGSTGDIATAGGTAYNYGQRVAQAVALAPQIVEIEASTNDIGQLASDITAARLATLQALRAGLPDAILVNVGVWPINNGGNTAAVTEVETAVAAAVTAFNDPKTFMIPFATAVPPVLVSGNRGLFVASDGVHPADIGSHHRARRIAQGYRKIVLPAI